MWMDTWTSHERVPFHLLNSSFPAGTCENLTTGHAVSWHPFFSSYKSSDVIQLPGGWNGAGLWIPQRQDLRTPSQRLTLQPVTDTGVWATQTIQTSTKPGPAVPLPCHDADTTSWGPLGTGLHLPKTPEYVPPDGRLRVAMPSWAVLCCHMHSPQRVLHTIQVCFAFINLFQQQMNYQAAENCHIKGLFQFLSVLGKMVSRKKEPEAAASSCLLFWSSWQQETTQDRNHHMINQEQENQSCYPDEEKVEDLTRNKNIKHISPKGCWGSTLCLYTDFTKVKPMRISPLTKMSV